MLAATFFTIAAMPSRAQSSGIVFRSVRVGGSNYWYEVYVPPEWSKAKSWPVILFLHGAGERGTYPERNRASVIARFFITYQKSLPAVVVFPRCAPGLSWSHPKMDALAMKALEQSIHEFHGDPARVYLTGLSMGGFGTWHLASKYPEKFAAIAPVCGGIRAPSNLAELTLSNDPRAYADYAHKLRDLPIWIFHGDADTVIPVEESRKMVAAMKAAGGNVRYSEYEGVGHNSWDRAYAEPEFFTWLFAQKRQ
ncbi:MAG: prolyl oligopeptidase family serine peptidase [Nevskiales bacterium]